MSELVNLDRDRFSVSFNEAAKALRESAMLLAVEIESVTDEASQKKAVEAQTALAEVAKRVEEARKQTKEPVLEFGRKIDEAARVFLQNVKDENTRISRMIGDFQAVERRRQLAEEQKRNEELTRLEREREAQLAKAKTVEAQEQVHEKFNEQVRSQAPVKVAPKVEGQVIKQDWEVTITDVRLLAQMHPDLVNIEPRRNDIKDRIKMGQKVHGVEAKPITVAGVRVKKEMEIAI